MKKTLLFLCIFSFVFSFAQVTNEGEPLSWSLAKTNLKQNKVVPIVLPIVNVDELKKEDEINDKIETKPWRFGYKHRVNYGINDAGNWFETKDGDRVWRILFESKGALSLNFIFDEFYMPEGAHVYLYSDDKKDLLGAYTSVQNQPSGELATWLVKGDKVWIEYFEPKEARGLGKLHISDVTHAYRNRETYLKSLGSSGDCNQDVDCPIGEDWEHYKEHVKKSVGLILVNGNGHCSGTLINNTNNDKKPYFLTANHCLNSSPSIWAFRFGWISSNIACGSADYTSNSGPTNMTISGSTLRANNSNSDFALLELNSAIPDSWNRVWSGWDRSDNTPSFTVGVHHPSGDVMKISRDNNAPTKVAQNAGGSSPVAQTWDITAAGGGWEIGVTEGGSSGSGLFDPNGRLIGQLYGGSAACFGENDNGGHDFYGRFAVSWNSGTTAATRLSNWLDPAGTNPVTLNGIPALAINAVDSKITSAVVNIDCNESNPEPEVTILNLGTTTLTSLTIDWDIDGGQNHTINWTGSLARNRSETIKLPTLNIPGGSHVLNVSTSNPNGTTDGDTANDVISNTFFFTQFATTQVKLSLTTDNFSNETTWQFRNSNGTLIASGGPYNGTTDDNTTFEETFNVAVNQCYTFTINDTESDGICCGFGNGSYTLSTGDNAVIFQGGSFGSSESTDIKIVGTLSEDEFLKKSVSIYPNPSNGLINISAPSTIGELKYEVYSVLGQSLKSSIVKVGEPIDLSNLPNNMYLFKIIDVEKNTSFTKKIILNK